MVSVPDHRIVILGAGQSATRSIASALQSIGNEKQVLDWQIDAFSGLENTRICFVSGYQAESVQFEHDDLDFRINQHWRNTGAAYSLRCALLDCSKSLFICYSDTLFRRTVVEALNATSNPITIAVDKGWKQRYGSRTTQDIDTSEKVILESSGVVDIGAEIKSAKADAEFTGIVKIDASEIDRLKTILRSADLDKKSTLPQVINQLGLEKVGVIDVGGEWAELNAPQDIARFVLGTKAESLERLRPIVKKSVVGNQVAISFKEYRSNPSESIKEVQNKFQDCEVIVRSSAQSEDGWNASSAGQYKSILNVPSTDKHCIKEAVEEVFDSYGLPEQNDQVLVQKMLNEVSMSGVIMTRSPTHGAPYFVINFDDTSNSTDTITSGNCADARTVYLLHGTKLDERLPTQLKDLASAVTEIIAIIGHDSLDIEFAFTENSPVHILQVRPIAISFPTEKASDENIFEGIECAVDSFRKANVGVPGLVGNKTLYSVMSDWNPAEIIGVKPNRLASSLYKYLITDEVWARHRASFGYRDVRPSKLMIEFLGHPFIDIRVDFNSFIPANITEPLAAKLVNYQMETLRIHPELHDKVEFDILFTCYAFNFDKRAAELLDNGFTRDEIEKLREELLSITNSGFKRLDADIRSMSDFEKRFSEIMNSDLCEIRKVEHLVETLRLIGTVTFSHLARHAFVAVSFIKSLAELNVISVAQCDGFMSSMKTVPSVMQNHANDVKNGHMDWEDFVGNYGHLRPGTYDITSTIYADASESYLRPLVQQSSPPSGQPPFQWDRTTQVNITKLLKDQGLETNFDSFCRYLNLSIEQREFSKFIFTKGLSAAIELVASFGKRHGFSRQQMSHVKINDLIDLASETAPNLTEYLGQLIDQGTAQSRLMQSICLPSQIHRESDFTCIEHPKSRPNFVTQKMVTGDIFSLGQSADIGVDLSNKIIVIPNADPGYDWIFGYNIGGLITMYGGVNSHMAIRVAEFEIPAAIGIGEMMFENITQAAVLQLDCAAGKISIVR